MPKYIDCEPLINNFSGGESMKSMSESIADARFVEALKKAPAADVAEVVHGEWKWGYGVGGQYGIWCTNCGAGYVDSPNAEWIAQEHDYCGKCGAKMDGKELKNGNA